ncbi:MAG: NADP-dependent glyceraldehyde-3-phosphate dehydrogenase [Myxococcales bacterium]|nr:NADP-dependent glyceraldehyde-3-phosphate dehydrogenase [Myxococcales bacterium]
MSHLRDSFRFPRADEIPERAQLAFPIEQREYLIDGVLRRWDGQQEDVLSPIYLRDAEGAATPTRIGSIPSLDGDAAMSALSAAVSAWDSGRGEWPTMPIGERLACLERFTHAMVDERERVVRLLMWEIGKSRKDSEKEFDRTVEYIRDTIDAVKTLDRASSRFEVASGIFAQIRRAPLGVVLCMGPFNYPLNETFTTLIPALVMGNVVVFKPPKLGVLLFGPLLAAFGDAFPAGVVNTVYGDGKTIISPLMRSGEIDVLAFIGTSRVADILKAQHPKPHQLRCVLGLDAKNPAIVLGDADVELAVNECLLGSLSFNGQRCTALKLLFVHESIAEAFVARFAAAVAERRVGLPWDDGVAVTPLPEPGKTARLRALVDDALSKGARIVNEGGGESDGSVFAPAVVFPVTPEMALYHEEQFGPIVPIVPFADPDEPVRYVVGSQYGQQASLFSSDPEKLAHLIDPLVNQVCRLNINSQCQRGPDTFPFTGRKSSAEGTLSVSDALRVFTIRTLVAAKDNELNRSLLRSITREHRSSFLSTDFIF